MDARTVLKTWLAETNPDRRGKEGRLLQGTSPDRYGEIVTDWLDFMDTVRLDPWRAQPSHVKTWLDSRGGAVRYRALRQSAVSAFYTYAMHFKHTRHDPALVELRGRPQDEPPGARLKPGQTELIRWAADQLEGDFAARDRLFMYLLLSGLRSQQITNTQLAGVAFEQHRMTIEVWKKGGGTGRYAFHDEVRGAVRAYLPQRTFRGPHSHEKRGPLLVSNRGKPLDPNTTPRTILKAVLGHALACPDPDAPELPARVTPDMVALSPGPFGELGKA
jgi:site-specific recombinase XerD